MARTWTVGWKGAVAAVLLLVGLLIIGGFGAGLLPLKHDSITRSTYDQIPLGMTLAEVRELLGSPGIGPNEVPQALFPDRQIVEAVEEGKFDNRPDDNEPGRRLVWVGRDSGLLIRVGEGNRVTDKMFHRLAPPTFLQRIQYRLKF